MAKIEAAAREKARKLQEQQAEDARRHREVQFLTFRLFGFKLWIVIAEIYLIIVILVMIIIHYYVVVVFRHYHTL